VRRLDDRIGDWGVELEGRIGMTTKALLMSITAPRPHGSDLDARDAHGRTALHYACETGKAGATQLLLGTCVVSSWGLVV
jgi:hypothetical protein